VQKLRKESEQRIENRELGRLAFSNHLLSNHLISIPLKPTAPRQIDAGQIINKPENLLRQNEGD
jgi:hypothetical protein